MPRFRSARVSLSIHLWDRDRTIAAAEAVGVSSIGIERHRDYFEMSRVVIPELAVLESPCGIGLDAQLQLL